MAETSVYVLQIRLKPAADNSLRYSALFALLSRFVFLAAYLTVDLYRPHDVLKGRFIQVVLILRRDSDDV